MKKHALLSTLLALSALLVNAPAAAANVEKTVDYKIDGKAHRGYVYYDEAKKDLPLVILVPNWLGANEANRKQAQQFAGSDYVVFVADMYGRTELPAGQEAAGKLVGSLYANRPLLRSRIVATKREAIRYATQNKLPADLNRIAAVGFCFGGATVLELARTGDDLAAVVSFHGNLSLEAPAQDAPIRTRILALHGDIDPYVPAKQVDAFLEEMRSVKPDWQLVRFGGAVHSFTDPDANTPGQAMYDAKIARRAFAMSREFLAEAFEGTRK